MSGIHAQGTGLLMLYNTEVPVGAKLTRDYAAFRKIDQSQIVGLTLPVEEKIDLATFMAKISNPLKRKLGKYSKGLRPQRILVFYGVPVFVETPERLRLVDRMISIIDKIDDVKDRVVLNPYWRKEIVRDERLPLLVSRLDAPTSEMAEQLLKGWKYAQFFGQWKRYLVKDPESSSAKRLSDHSFLINDNGYLKGIDGREIQYLEVSHRELSNFRQERPSAKLSMGAMVIKRDVEKDTLKPKRFRRLDGNSASLASSLGASFYVGRITPKLGPYEDYFDLDHFWQRYLSGESFIDATHGALAHLGGGVMIIGDPLYSPHDPEHKSEQNKRYESGRCDVDEYKKQFLVELEWYMLHSILKDWNDSKMNMAVAKCKGAVHIRKQNPVFSEVLASFYKKLGRQSDLDRLVESWSRKKLTPYHEELIKSYR